ncbi:MAG TPA: hypothetical protein VK742_17990 [Candidatus Sulfotelmatobacter sp.]|nr:hypothetical protein [Candidatus Sulfotelmatobacter sp.]
MRATVAILMLALMFGCATGGSRWNPATAVSDAEHDIAASRFQFAYVGGVAPYPAGLPLTDATYKVLNQYGRLEVGPQGCIQDPHSDELIKYAARYNHRMWRYVSEHK